MFDGKRGEILKGAELSKSLRVLKYLTKHFFTVKIVSVYCECANDQESPQSVTESCSETSGYTHGSC